MAGEWLATRYEGIMVNAGGQVLGKSGRVLRGYLRHDGYVVIGMHGLGRKIRVNILVCETFHGDKPSPAHEVAHGNGIRNDNRAENLRWATHAENGRDMARHGFGKGVRRNRGSLNVKAKLTEEQVADIRARAKEPRYAVAAEYGVTTQTIRRIVQGRLWV